MRVVLKLIVFIVVALLVEHQATGKFQCGVSQVKYTETIVGGQRTAAGAWPWHAAVFHKTPRTPDYACGGTLVNDKHIVTAAHCVTAQNGRQMLPEKILVRLGLNMLHDTGGRVQTHEVDTVIRFAGAAEHEAKMNDIALLKLKSVVEMTPYVQPACVNEEDNIAGMTGTIIGWGLTENDQLLEELRRAKLKIRTTDECLEANRDVFGQTAHGGIFCAGSKGESSACNGDSGGGLFVERNSTWYLAGVTSFTEAREDRAMCKHTGYTAFTRISRYLPWIQINSNLQVSHLSSNCGVYTVNRIARGQKASLFEFPWMAVILKSKNNMKYSNIGTLINNRYVLTSAGAVEGENIKVILGEHTRYQDKDCNPNNPTDCAPSTEKFTPEHIIKHENFDEYHNNIALIRLGRDVVFKDHIKPVCLPTTSALIQLSLPQYIVAGWGKDEHGKYHNDLRKATVQALETYVCEAGYIDRKSSYNFTGQEFCAGGEANGVDSCWDGAAPIGYMAQHEAGLRFVQFGIRTWGPTKCGTSPTIYLKLANYVEWIVMNMKP